MSAIRLRNKREDLFRKITGVIDKWPDRERIIFARVHYSGQTPESISQSLKLDIEEIVGILSKCEKELHSSLRNFRDRDHFNISLFNEVPSGRINRNGEYQQSIPA